MCADEFDQDTFEFVGHANHETKLVATDIENQPMIGDEIDGRPKIRLHIGWATSKRLVDQRVPSTQRLFRCWVSGPDLNQRPLCDNLHIAS